MPNVIIRNKPTLAPTEALVASVWWPRTLAAACLPLVVAPLAFAMIPTARIRAFIDSHSSKGHADTISPFVPDMQHRALMVAGVAALLALLILRFHRPVAQWIGEALDSVGPSIQDLRDGADELFTKDRFFTFLVLLVTLQGAAMRLAFINHSMFCDESNGYLDVHNSLGKVVATYTTTNNHVFNSILVRLSTAFFGTEPWAIRLPVFLAGVMMIPATYLAVRALFNSAAGLVAAGLVSSSPYLVRYSVDARGYSIICLLTLLTCALGCYVLRNRQPIAWLAIALFTAIGFYTVPIMLMPCAVGVVWMCLSIWREALPDTRAQYGRDLSVCLGLTGLFISLLYLPILVISGPKALVANKYVGHQTWPLFLQGCRDCAAELFRWANLSIPMPLVLTVLALAMLAVVCHARISRVRVSWFLTAIPVLAAVVLYQRAAPFARLWTFAFPFYYALAGAGFAFILTRLGATAKGLAGGCFAALVIYCGVVDASMLRTSDLFHDDIYPSAVTDVPAMTSFFKDQIPQGGLLYCLYPDIPVVEYYFHRAGLDAQYLPHGAKAARPFTFVFLLNPGLTGDDSLDTLNLFLAQRNLRPLRADELVVVRRFPLATLYRLATPANSKASPAASELLDVLANRS